MRTVRNFVKEKDSKNDTSYPVDNKENVVDGPDPQEELSNFPRTFNSNFFYSAS